MNYARMMQKYGPMVAQMGRAVSPAYARVGEVLFPGWDEPCMAEARTTLRAAGARYASAAGKGFGSEDDEDVRMMLYGARYGILTQDEANAFSLIMQEHGSNHEACSYTLAYGPFCFADVDSRRDASLRSLLLRVRDRIVNECRQRQVTAEQEARRRAEEAARQAAEAARQRQIQAAIQAATAQRLRTPGATPSFSFPAPSPVQPFRPGMPTTIAPRSPGPIVQTPVPTPGPRPPVSIATEGPAMAPSSVAQPFQPGLAPARAAAPRVLNLRRRPLPLGLR